MEFSTSQITNYVICGLIIILSLIVLFRSMQNSGALRSLIEKLDQALPHEGRDKKWDNDKDRVEIRRKSEKGQLEKIAEAEDEFSTLNAQYNTLCQVVTIFPLLGILGTVLGIIFMGDVASASMDSFALALWTTFWGLVASIVLKGKLALSNGRQISLFENKVDSYYRALDTISIRAKMNMQN